MSEPVPPGQTPIPVIVIQSHESFWDQALAIGTFALVLVTAAALMIEIHKDHEIIKALLRMLARMLPPFRRPAEEPDDEADSDLDQMPVGTYGRDYAGNVPL